MISEELMGKVWEAYQGDPMDPKNNTEAGLRRVIEVVLEHASTPSPETHLRGALAAITAERQRQIGKGYDAAHDDSHIGGEIVLSEWGARARIEAAINAGRSGDVAAYKELLTEAAAQCAAEIDRVERAEFKANA